MTTSARCPHGLPPVVCRACLELTVSEDAPWTKRADPEAPSGRIVGWFLVALVIAAALFVAWRMTRP